jgi:hypothetical protein
MYSQFPASEARQNSAGPHPTLPGKAKSSSANHQQHIWEPYTMTHAIRTRLFTLCLAILPAGIVFAQTQSSEAVPAATTPASAVAYVYVGTSKGVYLYDAASNGKLTLVSGSPFKTAGTATASNGKYFITVGTAYMHSYSVASNGAVKGQVSQIDTQNYLSSSGDGCGTTAGAVFDHTGLYIYAPIGIGECAALQSYKISSTGSLAFIGSTNYPYTQGETRYPGPNPPAVAANEFFAYTGVPSGDCNEDTDVFERQTDGALQFDFYADVNGIVPQPGFEEYVNLTALAADSSGHLAMPVQDESPIGCVGPALQLASYTQGSNGDLGTSSTWQNMPTLNVYPTVMKISPAGDLLAVGGDANHPEATITTPPPTAGLQLFHFNGADPITPYSTPLISASIDQILWDNNDHLYALSNSTHKLYVYTVTPTNITAAPGSPYTIANANALVVVPKSSCSAPTSAGVHVCSPASGASVSSPVLVTATSKVTGTIVSTQLWIDGVKNFNAPGSTTLTTSVTLAAGSHRFAVIATNTAGTKWENAVNATVK